MTKRRNWKPGEYEAMCAARSAKAAETLIAKNGHSVPRSNVYPFRNGWRVMHKRRHVGTYGTEEEAISAFRHVSSGVE
jgi:hypothetical protein